MNSGTSHRFFLLNNNLIPSGGDRYAAMCSFGFNWGHKSTHYSSIPSIRPNPPNTKIQIYSPHDTKFSSLQSPPQAYH